MSDVVAPKNWKDAIPSVAWGAVVFTCFFVTVEKVIEQNYGQAFFALIVGLAVMGIALHSQTWLERTNPTLAFAGALMALLALVASPMIERGWGPFQASSIIHDPPSDEDIAKAAAPLIAAARQAEAAAKAQAEAAIHDRDAARQERDAIRQQASSPVATSSLPAAPSETLSPEDVSTKIGIWVSVDQQMNEFAKALNIGYSLIDTWANDVKTDKISVLATTESFRTNLKVAVDKLESLRVAYPNYKDVYEALNTDALNKLFRSIEGFLQQIRSLPINLPENYENVVRPYSGALKRDLDVIRDWQSAMRGNAIKKEQELSRRESK
jgi:hypothetical protein